jgi:excisionase family DNA binding protein
MTEIISCAEPEWERVSDCARNLGVSRGTIYSLISAGKLDARKIGSRTIVSVASRRALVDSLPRIAARKEVQCP